MTFQAQITYVLTYLHVPIVCCPNVSAVTSMTSKYIFRLLGHLPVVELYTVCLFGLPQFRYTYIYVSYNKSYKVFCSNNLPQ